MSDEVRRLVEFGRLAHRRTLGWIHPGAVASEIAAKYRRLFEQHGYEESYLYGPCHGLGMIEVEPPWMEETSDYELVENMTFQVDTFVQGTGFGLRWENGIRVASGGPEMFSSDNMEILEMA